MRFVRTSKYDSLVDQVDMLNVNPTYDNVRHLDERKTTFQFVTWLQKVRNLTQKLRWREYN